MTAPTVRTRAHLALLAALLLPLTLLSLPAAPPASAAPAVVATAAPDFASSVFNDPWDFTNPEDMLLDNGGPAMGLEAPRFAGGQLSFTMSRPGYLSPLWGGYPGALYLGREGGAPANRIDAARFTRLSLHAYASRDTPAGIMWWTCEGLDPACQGGQPLQLRAGWNTYDVLVANSGYGLPRAWAGSITGLRLALSPASSTEFSLDWMRLYDPAGISAPARTWDADDDPSDNTSSRPGHGPVPGSDLSFLPAGSWFLGDTQVTLRRPSHPVILDPDARGGLDYASSQGDPWDLNGSHDVAEVGNADILGLGGGTLTARNTARPDINDPFVWMRTPTPIDTNRFHRLTVASSYQGPFNLEDRAGGGTHGRVVWSRSDQPRGTVVQTKEWVTYSGASTQTYDLTAPGIHEDDVGNKLPWNGSSVLGLRWDPNEDRGPRVWNLHRVELRADDEANEFFDVRWYDAGWVPGSSITFYRDSDATGFNGVAISPALSQHVGINTFRWNSSATPPGRHHLYAVIDSPAGTSRSYATGPVQVRRDISAQSPSPISAQPREITQACPSSRPPTGAFSDTAASSHALAIDCAAWWGVAAGSGSNTFNPSAALTRAQMASFVVRMLDAANTPLPTDPADAFDDDTALVHERAINQLAALGVASGTGPRTFSPSASLTRAQMATFLARAWEAATGAPLVASADFFQDDTGSTHEGAINRVAAAGIAAGTGEGRYSPASALTRAQMATFLMRELDALVAAGRTSPPSR